MGITKFFFDNHFTVSNPFSYFSTRLELMMDEFLFFFDAIPFHRIFSIIFNRFIWSIRYEIWTKRDTKCEWDTVKQLEPIIWQSRKGTDIWSNSADPLCPNRVVERIHSCFWTATTISFLGYPNLFNFMVKSICVNHGQIFF